MIHLPSDAAGAGPEPGEPWEGSGWCRLGAVCRVWGGTGGRCGRVSGCRCNERPQTWQLEFSTVPEVSSPKCSENQGVCGVGPFWGL